VRALVTGGTGFLGHHLVTRLLAEGCDVAVTSIPGDPLLSRLPSGVRGYGYDVRDADASALALREQHPDVVFHLAALLRGRSLAALLAVNAGGTDVLLAAAREMVAPPRVVIPGSASEYGVPDGERPLVEEDPLRPISPYGISKAAQTLTGLSYARRNEVPVIVGRVFNMSGPGEPRSMLCGALASQVAEIESRGRSGAVSVGNLSPFRDYLDVRDVVGALWNLANSGEPATVYNICSGTARQVAEVADHLVSLSRVPVELVPDPTRQRASDIPYCRGSAARLKAATGWLPDYPLATTLADTLDSWRDRAGAT